MRSFRVWLEPRLLRRWYGRARPSLWQQSLSRWLGQRVSRRAERRRAAAIPAGVPVVVVGNITVGGSGKTPTVIALARWLAGRNHRPAIVSRGYGGSEKGPKQVDAQAPQRFGDEACLMAQQAGCPVVVGRDRAGAVRLAQSLGATVVISDDGLQHYRMARDIELVLLDGARGLGNGLMLPFGPLREPAQRLSRVDQVLSVGERTAALATDRIVLREGALYRLASGAARVPQAGDTVHAVSGIANPQRFFASLRRLGLEPIEHPWPDHHPFNGSEVVFADDLAVVVTEKDAIKLSAGRLSEQVWVLPVEAQLPESLKELLIHRLPRSPGKVGGQAPSFP